MNDKSWRDADEDKEQTRDKIKKIEQDIEFRSGQINDIQERLMDADQGNLKHMAIIMLSTFQTENVLCTCAIY